MQICESQGVDHGPHGLHPSHFPVFSKPIYNMRGMGAGSRVLRTAKEYQNNLYPGHFWMELLAGDHVSTDVAIVDGQATWWRHVTAKPLEGGMFDYWTVLADHKPEIETYCGEWLAKHFRGYTGMVNLETIGGRIIECHLRFSDQWPDLYGKGWVEALVRLYEHGEWRFDDSQRRTGYSVVLFGAHGLSYKHPDPGGGPRNPGKPGGLERPDHLPRGSAAALALDAARRLPARHRQLLGPGDRHCRARMAGACRSGRPRSSPAGAARR